MTDKQKSTIIRFCNDGVTLSEIAEGINLSIRDHRKFCVKVNNRLPFKQ